MDALSSFLNLIPVTLVSSLVHGYVALAVMLPFRLLSFPDLTSEGSFPLGGTVCAALLLAGVDPFLATLLAVLAGALAGSATALVHLRFGINTLLAGILVMTALYSVDLRILGKSNVALFTVESVFSRIHPALLFSEPAKIAVLAATMLVVVASLWLLLRTEAGTSLRAVGDNTALAPALGISVAACTLVGLAAANGVAAFSGALLVQMQGFADIGMGFGALVTGLAALVIGESLIGRETIGRQMLAPVLGAIVYFQIVSLGLALGLHPSDLKLATALFVLAALALATRFGGMRGGREALKG